MNELTERQRLILALVVRHYTETAQPVGSARLVERYKLDRHFLPQVCLPLDGVAPKKRANQQAESFVRNAPTSPVKRKLK